MRRLRPTLGVVVTVVLVGGSMQTGLALDGEPDAMVFPTGTFVSVENPNHGLAFDEDGTGRYFEVEEWEIRISYAVNGDLWTEMTFEYSDGQKPRPQTPATYYWDWDGEHLTFEVWGEDLRHFRAFVFGDNTWRKVEDPVEVLVAVRDIPAGEPVYARWTDVGLASAKDAGEDALTYGPDVVGSLASVDIAKGQPITPDLLEPAE